jgi:hypothetical protein
MRRRVDIVTERLTTLGLVLATAMFTVCQSRTCLAQSTIRNPGDHIDYVAELEPHFLLGLDPPGDTSGTGFGLGLRATIPIVKNGFISTINNSVGITFGLDWLRYSGQDVAYGPCVQWIPGPNSTLICTRVGSPYGGAADYIYLPVAMQWNFWLHQQFSVFGEPGLVIYDRRPRYYGDSNLGLIPMLDLGGRWHFSKPAALVFRFGYPTFSLGVSFFL